MKLLFSQFGLYLFTKSGTLKWRTDNIGAPDVLMVSDEMNILATLGNE